MADFLTSRLTQLLNHKVPLFVDSPRPSQKKNKNPFLIEISAYFEGTSRLFSKLSLKVSSGSASSFFPYLFK
jgi:hypothetical protein